MKKRKKIVLFMLALVTVCFLSMGIVFGKVESANEPMEAATYYYVDGKPVQALGSSGQIGGSKKNRDTAKTLSTVSYVAAALSGVGFLASAIFWKVGD